MSGLQRPDREHGQSAQVRILLLCMVFTMYLAFIPANNRRSTSQIEQFADRLFKIAMASLEGEDNRFHLPVINFADVFPWQVLDQIASTKIVDIIRIKCTFVYIVFRTTLIGARSTSGRHVMLWRRTRKCRAVESSQTLSNAASYTFSPKHRNLNHACHFFYH